MRLLRPSAIGLLLAGLLLSQTNAASAQLASKGCPNYPSLARPWQILTDDLNSSEPLQILTDTMAVDFNPYLTGLLREVKEHWYQLIPESAEMKRGKVVLEFQVLKDGRVDCLSVVESSGDAVLDRPAYGSIAGCNPFSPLPKEFRGPYLGLRFSYYYNREADKFERPRLNISPAGSTVAAGSTVQFRAFENDKGAAVTWSIISCDETCGTISSAGLYSAPPKIPNPSKVRIRATVVLIPNSTAETTVMVVEQKASAPGTADLLEAATLYRNGKLDEAAQRYQQLLQLQPKSAEAYAGLTRVFLKQKKVQQARDTISKGLAVVDSAPIRVALGEVLFREGKLAEAEAEWLNVLNSGHVDARTHLGLARVSAAALQYRQAKAEVDKAYLLDPNDPDIQAFWTRSVSPSGQTTCRVSGSLAPLETDLLVLSGDRPSQTRGYGLNVSVNGQNSRLLVDTGSHGIVIDRKLAQKAGLTKISDTKVGGFGDQGRSTGYFATASSIKVGVLEFRDCPVTVIDKRSVLGEDGLIGTDVFEQFLIDLDFPNNKLRLGKLPRLTDKDPGEASTADTARPTYTTLAKRFRPADFSFSFVPVYRFGHLLLIPTEVGELPDQRLFAIDTGAPRNILSLSTARDFTKVNENARVAIKGLRGSVKRVYDAEKTALHFANVQQYADAETALNLEAMSDEVGTEVSGVLGVLNLRTLDVVLDYRDGFVAFDFTPEH